MAAGFQVLFFLGALGAQKISWWLWYPSCDTNPLENFKQEVIILVNDDKVNDLPHVVFSLSKDFAEIIVKEEKGIKL